MDPYEMIKAHLGRSVPYATHTGVELLDVGDGLATARLVQRMETENHIKGQHAGGDFNRLTQHMPQTSLLVFGIARSFEVAR